VASGGETTRSVGRSSRSENMKHVCVLMIHILWSSKCERAADCIIRIEIMSTKIS
jgi:hypothetical protein